jgi:hypothetical protein
LASVLQILEIGCNFLFSVSKYGRNLQSAAQFFVSFVDQKALWFGYRCFEKSSGGCPHINRIKVSAILAIRRVGEAKSFEAKLDVALNLKILNLECTVMDDALSVRPRTLWEVWLQKEVDDTTAAAGAYFVTDAISVDATLLSTSSVLHELIRTVGISQ